MMTNRRWKHWLAGAAAGLLLAAGAAGRAPAGAVLTASEAALRAVAGSARPYSGEATLPLRATFEGMGWTVTWDAKTRSARLARKGHAWTAAEGKTGLTGTTNIAGSAPNRIEDGVFRLPARTAAKLLESARKLETAEASAQTAGTASGSGSANAGGRAAQNAGAGRSTQNVGTFAEYTEEDLLWLARIIEAEAGGEPMEGKIAVGNTILNRVKSADYPDTIYGVLFDRKWGVQYTPTSNGTIWNDPSGDAWDAARRCLEGENPVEDCLFFLNPRIAKSFWIVENREYYCSIGGHDFYR